MLITTLYFGLMLFGLNSFISLNLPKSYIEMPTTQRIFLTERLRLSCEDCVSQTDLGLFSEKSVYSKSETLLLAAVLYNVHSPYKIRWTVSSGRIISGQNSLAIKIDPQGTNEKEMKVVAIVKVKLKSGHWCQLRKEIALTIEAK